MSLQHSIPYLLIWFMMFTKALENYQSPSASKEVPLLGKKKKKKPPEKGTGLR